MAHSETHTPPFAPAEVQPPSLAKPRGYANGLLFPPGRMLFVAGQIGWDAESRLVEGGFVPQFDQALANVVAVVREAGGEPQHIGRLTLYVTDKQAYLAGRKAVGEAYRRHMGRAFPAMALVQVADLLEEGALIEIEATAVIP